MSDRPYVDLHEAVRIVVRLMPDGPALASKITNEWIMEGLGRFDAPDDGSDDFMVRLSGPDWKSGPDWESVRSRVDAAYDAAAGQMVRLYGQDWRDVRPRVIGAFEKAVGLLRQLARTGRIHGVGISDATPKPGRRDITQDEWSSLRLNIPRGTLEATDLPTIRRVLPKREQVVGEATSRLMPPEWGSNEHKHLAVEQAIDALTIPFLARMSLVIRELAVITHVAEANGGLTVTDRYVRELWKEAKERLRS